VPHHPSKGAGGRKENRGKKGKGEKVQGDWIYTFYITV